MASRAQSEEQNVILDSISEGVFTVDLNWRITSFNRAAEEITGIQREKAIGQRCRDILRAELKRFVIPVRLKSFAKKSKDDRS